MTSARMARLSSMPLNSAMMLKRRRYPISSHWIRRLAQKPLVLNGPITLDSLHSTVLNIRLSPEGQTALIARFDGRVELWDITTGEYVRTFTSSTTNVMGLAFSPDGRTAVGGSYIVDHGEIILWDVATGVEIRQFTGLGDTIWLTSITFSPDGRRLLAGDGSGEIMVWDTLTGEEIRRYEMPVGAVNTVAFSHDGQMILASGDAGTFLWETETGNFYAHFPAGRLSLTPLIGPCLLIRVKEG